MSFVNVAARAMSSSESICGDGRTGGGGGDGTAFLPGSKESRALPTESRWLEVSMNGERPLIEFRPPKEFRTPVEFRSGPVLEPAPVNDAEVAEDAIVL